MRISDWSSDVCSSDLEPPAKTDTAATSEAANPLFTASTLPFAYPPFDKIHDEHFVPAFEKGMAEDRKSVVEGKSVSVRVDLGGRRILKKKNNSMRDYRHIQTDKARNTQENKQL